MLKRCLFTVAWLLALYGFSFAAITQNGSVCFASPESFASGSFAVSGSNRYLVVAVTSGGSIGTTVTGCTYAGMSMTELANGSYLSSYASALYGLLAPATGTNTLRCDVGIAANIVVSAVLYTGVDPTTPSHNVAAVADYSVTTVTLPVTSDTGEVVVSGIAASTTWSVSGGGTGICSTSVGSGFGGIAEFSGASTVNTSWGGPSDAVQTIAVSLIPVGGGPPPPPAVTPLRRKVISD